MRTVFFDLETKYSSEDVGGWGNIIDMGMSCGVLWDTKTEDFSVYLDTDIEDLIAHMKEAELIVGFNHIGFDHMVVAGAAHAGKEDRQKLYTELVELNNMDMLVELKKTLGHRLKLDSIARPTLGVGKSADGLQALQWYKEGKLDKIIEYCKVDVEVTRDVYKYALSKGELQYESRSGVKKVKVDWEPTEPKKPAMEQMSLF